MKLGLGTVQFGIPYGVANTYGRPNDDAVKTILQRSAKVGIRVIDTASLYGESEVVLGRCLPNQHNFDIVTKTPKFAGMTGREAANTLHAAFDTSCIKLGVTRVFGLLAHNADDLLGPAGDALWHKMVELRSVSRVTKIGASVYSGYQIDSLLQRYPLNLVQLPLSLLDQRLAQSGHLDLLKSRGIEVHVRSAFLQGALLMPLEKLPSHLTSLRPFIERIATQAATQGIDTLSAALRYVAGLPQVDAVICGVDSIDQFDGLATAMKSSSPALSPAQVEICACNNAMLIDPSQWKSS